MSIAEAVGERRTAKSAAMEFLQGALAGDPVQAAELTWRACEHGLTPKAIRAAREALGVKIERRGFGPRSKSLWSLPRKRIDAHPTSQGGASAGRRENRQPKPLDGYEVFGLEPDEPCTYCGERGDAPVYLVQGLCKGFGREPLHEVCAGYFFEFYRRINKGGQA
jgi:hypothetical protein